VGSIEVDVSAPLEEQRVQIATGVASLGVKISGIPPGHDEQEAVRHVTEALLALRPVRTKKRRM
jgi:hypothetical protein